MLADTEDAWTQMFRQNGQRYIKPTLVLFADVVDSACGFAQAATGPFYCPADQQIYIDLSFYQDLRGKLGAPGDFAQAYANPASRIESTVLRFGWQPAPTQPQNGAISVWLSAPIGFS